MISTEVNGLQIATARDGAVMSPKVPYAIGDALALFCKENGEPRSAHPGVKKFLQFLGSTAQETPLHLIETKMEAFSAYLHDRQYHLDTAKVYRYNLRKLLTEAGKLGWTVPETVIHPDWSVVLSLTTNAPMKSIVLYANRNGRLPSTLTEIDLKGWVKEQIVLNSAYATCRQSLMNFRKLMANPELAHLHPMVKPQADRYAVVLRDMSSTLQTEILTFLGLLLDPLDAERDGKALRKPTTEIVLGTLERLTGYIERVCARPRVESIAALLTPEHVVPFIKWKINVRGCLPKTSFNEFSHLISALKKSPRYKDLDLKWLTSYLKKLDLQDQSEISRRKEPRYISFEEAKSIPKQLREKRQKAKELTPHATAVSLRDELLMTWLTVLPWRVRNLQECRLSGGAHSNLYKASVRRHDQSTQSKWVKDLLQQNPKTLLWQIYFSKDETKGKTEVTGFLPGKLSLLLDEYLACRPALIPHGQPDPGMLFVTDGGEAYKSLYVLIVTLSAEQTGVAVNPHLFRDIFAYAWLKENDGRFEPLSKMLWHKSLEETQKVYGSRFNESTGIAYADDWQSPKD